MRKNILIVDDEPVQVKVFEKFIEDMDHNIITFNGGADAVDYFLNKKTVKNIPSHEVDVMLLDLSMPDVDGLDVLRQIVPIKGDLQIIVLTASNDVSAAVTAINLGAADYIVKGEKDVFARVMSSINNAIEKKNLKHQVSNLERKDKGQVLFSDIVGRSNSLVSAVDLSKKIINSTIPVLIEGLSGTGKELLARAIHGSGIKSGKPFVVVDCETLRSDAADDILFGYEKALDGGIIQRSVGAIRESNGGTLFLDNVGFLKPDIQVKLLRFIQEGEVRPVGTKVMHKVSVRIISSTDRSLKTLSKRGKFREDLYYRLSIFPIVLPCLSERGVKDIKLLAERFCQTSSVNENKKIKGISDEAMYLLANYDWEDNVRQLKNYIFRAVVLCDEDFLQPKHFPQILNLESANGPKKKTIVTGTMERDSEMFDIFGEEGLCKSLDTIEAEIVERLVDLYDGNLSEVAKKLEVSRSTVYRKLNMNNG